MTTSAATRPVLRTGVTFGVRDRGDSISGLPLMQALIRLEGQVRAGEKEDLRLRWRFGQELLPLRKGKKILSKGHVDEICADCGISRRELARRMRFAERYADEDELCHGVAQFPTWHEMCAHGLYEKREPKAQDAPGETYRKALVRALQQVAEHLDELDPKGLTPTDVQTLRDLLAWAEGKR